MTRTTKASQHVERLGTAPGRERLRGRRVLVIGAGQQSYGMEDAPIGNGRAISALCGKEGASVAVSDIDPTEASRTAELVEEEGATAVTLAGDASDEADVERMVNESVAALGGLDGLVMNVGVPRGFRLAGTSASDWDEAFAINVRSHFLGCKHALAAMADGSSIVLISSIAGYVPINEIPSYHASKAALTGLCHYVARDGAERGVRVNIVAPGLIDTSLGRLASKADPTRSEKPVPIGRQGTAWEVAYPVAFLLSNEASYITGQTLLVDGGYVGLR